MQQTGYLILNGGDAFSPKNKSADHIWLQLIRGHTRPRLVVLPTAMITNEQKTADEVMRYFNYLGTFAEYKVITTPLLANTRTEYEVLDKVEAIVLTDGSPIDLVERLTDTHTLEALHRTIEERRGAVMAAGASAMAMGSAYWFANEWEPGLALAPHLAILAHHNLVRMRLTPDRLLSNLPEGLTLLGIDQTTTLISHPDGTYQVEGTGTVTVYWDVDQLDEYRAGQRFTLETPDSA